MKVFTFLLISIVLISCKQERFEGFKEKSPDLYYQRIALGDGIPFLPISSFINYTVRFAPFDSLNPVAFNSAKTVKFAQTNFFKPESDLLYGLTKGDRLILILLNKPDLFKQLTFENNSGNIKNWIIDITVEDVVSLSK
jgi:hypothetical protein